MDDINVRTGSGIGILAGLWLILSPFVLGFNDVTNAMWNTLILGIAVVVFSLVRMAGREYSWAGWINFVMGLYLILAPFLFGYASSTNELWNSIIFGIIVAISGVWTVTTMTTTSHPMT